MKETHNTGPHDVSSLELMTKHIIDNIKDKVINTSDDIHHSLAQFGLCVDIINIFLEQCVSEQNQNNGSYTVGLTQYDMCSKMVGLVHPHSPSNCIGPNINELVKNQINHYQATILKLWSDVLIHQGKIKLDTIDEMKMVGIEQEGYERKMRELYEKCEHLGSFRSNLDESILLEWLALFNVASIAQITETYVDIGSLDYIIFGILSQFMPLNNDGYYGVQQSKNNASKFNVLHLTCYMILPTSASSRLPIFAYLASDVLDQLAIDIGQFPTMDQFMTTIPTAQERFQTLKARLIERQLANQSYPNTYDQPIKTAQERFHALKARLLERQLANQNSLITIEQPVQTAHARFQVLKAQLQERQKQQTIRSSSKLERSSK
jgi:hypothetical protein